MDPSPERWKPAVTSLVQELSSSGEAGRGARQNFKQLLWSEQPELQLRGIFGLQFLAKADSDAVAEFVADSWRDPANQRDPVKLYQLSKCCAEMRPEVLARLLELAWNEELPLDVALSTIELVVSLCLTKNESTLLEQLISHPEEQVRARVAMELLEQVDFDRQPSSLISTLKQSLRVLASDPIREVRASLASVLTLKLMSPTTAALGSGSFLAQLAESMNADADEQVRSLLRSVQVAKRTQESEGPGESLAVAAQLSGEPETSLSNLAPWMRTAGAFHRLKSIGDFSSSLEVTATANALAALVNGEVDFSERLLGCIGYLRAYGREKEPPRQEVLSELKDLAKLCLAVVEAPSLIELSDWATSVLESADTPEFAHLDAEDLFLLLEILSNWRANGPSWLRTELQQLLNRADQHLLPERELLEPVLRHLSEVISDEWENLLDDSI